MISAVTGEIREVVEDRVYLEVGPMVLEVLVPASEIEGLRGEVGSQVTFHTMLYLEGDSSGGNSEPRLLGFMSLQDKRFFEKFITVKGIGPRKALKALVAPTGEIAEAIEAKDARRLSQLPGIGKRTAETVIAELSGKVEAFVLVGARGMKGRLAAGGGGGRTQAEEDAIMSLVALGERRGDAEALLDRARTADPLLAGVTKADSLVRAMLRLRGSR